MVGGMNPLRLAALDASPFCGAKGGGFGGGGRGSLCPPYRSTGQASDISPLAGETRPTPSRAYPAISLRSFAPLSLRERGGVRYPIPFPSGFRLPPE